MPSSKSYLKWVFGSIVTGLLLVTSWNYAVDPFGVFHSYQVPGWNLEKPAVTRYMRLHKAHEIVRQKPRGLLLGSSRVECGLSPRHPLLVSQHAPYYNAGMSSETLYEMLRYLQHAHAAGHLHHVIFEVNFWMFHIKHRFREGFSEERLLTDARGVAQPFSKIADYPALLWSYKAILESISTVRNQDGAEIYDSTGMRPHGMMEKVFRRNGICADTLQSFMKNNYVKFSLYDEQGYSPTLESFSNILQLAYASGIPLYTYISPIHASLLETIQIAGLWDVFENLKVQLIHINESLARMYGVPPFPLWDFGGAYLFNLDALGLRIGEAPGETQWYWEPSHYRVALGDVVIQRMIGNAESPRFGVRLHSHNIHTHLSQLRQMQHIYRNQHPEVGKMLQKYWQTLNPVGVQVAHK